MIGGQGIGSDNEEVFGRLLPTTFLDGSYAEYQEDPNIRADRIKATINGRSDYEIIKSFKDKWGESPLNTPERTLNILAPDLRRIVRGEELEEARRLLYDSPINLDLPNQEANIAKESLSLASTSSIQSTGVLYRDAAQKPVPNKKEFVNKLIEDYMIMLGVTTPNEKQNTSLFIDYYRKLQNESNWLIDPNKLRSAILREYAIDNEMYAYVAETSMDITMFLKEGWYNLFDSTYEKVKNSQLNFDTLIDVGKNLGYGAINYVVPTTALVAGGFIVGPIVKATGLYLAELAGTSSTIAALGARISSAFTSNAWLGKTFMSASTVGKVLGYGALNVYAGGVGSRLLAPIANEYSRTSHPERLTEILNLTERKDIAEQYSETNWDPITILKQDTPLFLEMMGLGVGLAIGYKGAKAGVLNALKQRSIRPDKQPDISFMSAVVDAELPEEINEHLDVTYEVARSVASYRDDGLHQLSTDQLSMLADANPNKDSLFPSSEPESPQTPPQSIDFEQELGIKGDPYTTVDDIQTSAKFINELTHPDVITSGLELYNYKEVGGTQSIRSTYLKILLSRIVASSIDKVKQKATFENLISLVDDPKFEENQANIDIIFEFIHSRIDFPFDNSSMLSNRMKLNAMLSGYINVAFNLASEYHELETGQFKTEQAKEANAIVYSSLLSNKLKRFFNNRINSLNKEARSSYKESLKQLKSEEPNTTNTKLITRQLNKSTKTVARLDKLIENSRKSISIAHRNIQTRLEVLKRKGIDLEVAEGDKTVLSLYSRLDKLTNKLNELELNLNLEKERLASAEETNKSISTDIVEPKVAPIAPEKIRYKEGINLLDELKEVAKYGTDEELLSVLNKSINSNGDFFTVDEINKIRKTIDPTSLSYRELYTDTLNSLIIESGNEGDPFASYRRENFVKFIKEYSTIKDKPINLPSFLTAFMKAFNISENSIISLQSIMDNLTVKFNENLHNFIVDNNFNVDIEALKAHIAQITIYPETSGQMYEGRNPSIPIEYDSQLSRLGFNEINEHHKSNYKRLIAKQEPANTNPDRTLEEYYPVGLDYSLIGGLIINDTPSFVKFIDSHYNSLDLDKTQLAHEKRVEFELDGLYKRYSQDNIGKTLVSITPEEVNKIAENKNVNPKLKMIIDEYSKTGVERGFINKVITFAKNNNYGELYTKEMHAKIIKDVALGNTKLDSVYGELKVIEPVTQPSSILSSNKSRRVFFYKSYITWHDIAQEYGVNPSSTESFLFSNRANISKLSQLDTFKGIALHKGIIDTFVTDFNLKSSRSDLNTIVTDIQSSIMGHIVRPILDKLLDIDRQSVFKDSQLVKTGIHVLSTLFNTRNLGGMGLTAAVTDPINLIVNSSKLRISLPVVLGSIKDAVFAKMKVTDYNDIRLAIEDVTRYQLSDYLSVTNRESRLRPKVAKFRRGLNRFNDFFHTLTGARGVTLTLLNAAKTVTIRRLFQEMQRGEYGDAWKGLESFGTSKAMFDSLKSFHTESDMNFLFNLMEDTSVGRRFNGAVEYYSKQAITHASPTTRLFLSSLGPASLATLTFFYLSSTNTQETMYKLIWPLFFTKDYSSIGKYILGDIIAAALLKGLKGLGAGKSPDLSDFNFYKDLGNDMPSISPLFKTVLAKWLNHGFQNNNLGILTPAVNLISGDIVKFADSISPLATFPLARIYHERYYIDNLYKAIHQNKSKRHFDAINRYAAERGEPYFVKRG